MRDRWDAGESLDVVVSWPVGRKLSAHVQVVSSKGELDEDADFSIAVSTRREREYALWDALQAGQPLPDILTPAQRDALTGLPAAWGSLCKQAKGRLSRTEARAVDWTRVVISDREHRGAPYLTLTGQFEDGARLDLDEHGVEVVFLHGAIVEGPGISQGMPHDRIPPVEERDDPRHRVWNLAEVCLAIREADWPAVRDAMSRGDPPAGASEDIAALCAHLPAPQACHALTQFPRLFKGQVLPDWLLRECDHDPKRLRPFLTSRAYSLPPDVLSRSQSVADAKFWVALGADLRAPRLLLAHIKRPEVFEVLLSLGADVRVFGEDDGRYWRMLPPALQALVGPRLDPKEEAPESDDPSDASAVSSEPSALPELLARRWIELDEDVDMTALTHVVDALVNDPKRRRHFARYLMELPGIAEVFASDEEFAEFLDGW